MNKGFKIVLGVALLMIIIGLVWQYYRIRDLEKVNQIQSLELMLTGDSVREFRTREGEAYYRMQSVVIENDALKGSLLAMDIDKNILKSKNITLNNVISLLRQDLLMRGRDTIWLTDTVIKVVNIAMPVDAKGFNWTNHYLSLSGLIINKKMEFAYSYATEITSVTEQKGDKSIVTVSLEDPKAKIIGGAQIIVIPTKRWWDRWYIYGLVGAGVGVWIGK